MPAVDPYRGLGESGLGPPRFSLRSLLLVITSLCCLFAVMSAVGTMWSIVILLFASLFLAHVLGNSLGTWLRDGASQQLADEHRLRPAAPVQNHPPVVAPQRLTQRARLSRITLVMTVSGALVGAAVGGTGSAVLYPEAGAGPVALGVVSASVLLGLAGFLTSSFVSVGGAALREALAAGDPVARRHGSSRR